MNADQIDPKVLGWVDVINSYPDLQTIGSCGGHKHPEDCDQAPENEFYIEFRFMPHHP